MYKCPHSDAYYEFNNNTGITNPDTACEIVFLSSVCKNDPGSYQACGHTVCKEYQIQSVIPTMLCGTGLHVLLPELGWEYAS